MNLLQAFSIYGGGIGSGPTAPCPQCGPKIAHKLESGDTVKTKAPVIMFNLKTGNNVTLPPGTKATVLHVLPKVADNPQLVSINVKGHDPEYMKHDDLEFHKLGDKGQAPELKPVRPSKTILKFKTADGADVTWVRPHVENEKDTKTLKDIAQEPHSLKGGFELTQSLKGIQDRPGYVRVTKVYETTGMPFYLQKGRNAVLYVNTYSQKNKIKNVVIQEQNLGQYGNKSSGVLSFDYKNTAAAVGMLKSRYGVIQQMKRLPKAKFGADYGYVTS
jgi:hypothetical protein